MKKISARNLVVSEEVVKSIENMPYEYKKGFFYGYATCKAQAVKEGYHQIVTTMDKEKK